MEKREIILENYKNPFGKGLIEDKTYEFINMNNESCIDEINLMVKIENNIIKDIRFSGEACAICTSSTSLMIKNLIGKNIEEAKEIYDHLVKMLDGKEYDKELLNDLIVYEDIKNQPGRRLCVLLPWNGIMKVEE